jgi:nitrogen PTS system EIIA component
MSVETILTIERTRCGISVNSKKRLLEQVAQIIGEDQPDVDTDALFNELLTRERLGSTGIGHGVAIPHCRSEQCKRITGALIKLSEAIEFEAIDDQPVDLFFALVVPNEAHDEHLTVLASLAESFNNASYRNGLRKSETDQQLFENALRKLT